MLKKAVMFTAKIDTFEGRDNAVVDIPGAYLSAEIDNKVHVVFMGTLVEHVVSAKPVLYQPFLSYTTGQAVLYFLTQKSLYGCLKSALLFYEKLVGYLEAYKFKINLTTRLWQTIW